MVMDMFYAYVEMEKKKRVHFHGFMLDVHKSKLMIWKKWFYFIYFFLFMAAHVAYGISWPGVKLERQLQPTL